MTYTHRNGETTAPTAKGLYWFRGVIENYLNNGIMQRPIEVINTSGEVLAWNDSMRSFREVEEFDGQWWGPIVPPWEVAE